MEVANYYAVVVLILWQGLIDLIAGQSLAIGPCPPLRPVSDFSLKKYSGKWYENRKNQKYYRIVDGGLKCTVETYSQISNDTIQVSRTGIFSFGGREFSQSGTAHLMDSSSNRLAKLGFSYPDHFFSPKDASYWVLDTDYTSYSVVWSCTSLMFTNLKIFWILTRERFPAEDVVRSALDVFDKNGIGHGSLVETNQQGCPS